MPTSRLTNERCLILSDGGLESAVVAAIAAEQTTRADTEPPVVLASWWGETADLDLVLPSIDQAVARQAEMYGLGLIPDLTGYPPEQLDGVVPMSVGAQQTQLLLQGAACAAAMGISKIIWPIRIGRAHEDFDPASDLDGLASTIDRAILAGRLSTLDAGQETRIETPVVDFSNAQLADLAGDLSVPLDACWWFHDRSVLPSAEAEHQYWTKLSVLRVPSAGSSTEIKSTAVDKLLGH